MLKSHEIYAGTMHNQILSCQWQVSSAHVLTTRRDVPDSRNQLVHEVQI